MSDPSFIFSAFISTWQHVRSFQFPLPNWLFQPQIFLFLFLFLTSSLSPFLLMGCCCGKMKAAEWSGGGKARVIKALKRLELWEGRWVTHQSQGYVCLLLSPLLVNDPPAINRVPGVNLWVHTRTQMQLLLYGLPKIYLQRQVIKSHLCSLEYGFCRCGV